MKRHTLLLSIFVLFLVESFSQRTVGLLTYEPNKTSEGYTLLYPNDQGNVYLINNCGEVVNAWEDSLHTPGYSAYLSPDGRLYRCNTSPNANPYINGGGGGEFIERRSWDNQLEWKWYHNDSTQRLHHDIAVMPNGHVLAISWEKKSIAEAIVNGRNPSLVGKEGVWPDKIIEVRPIGIDSAEIVWEWHAWDHLVQDYDSTKLNYGVVSDNPGRININFAASTRADWIHLNSIAYNPYLDQIMVCGPFLEEIWIIDHSTSTAEAGSNKGGKSGIGGELMYRWGNPEAYGQGLPSDQKLFFEHDSHWIDEHIDSKNPDFGKVIVFNNRAGINYSEIGILEPEFDTVSWRYLTLNGRFLPDQLSWTYRADTPSSFFSSGQAGCQRLWNGNTLICEAQKGRIFEIDNQKEIVWEYEIPMNNGKPVAQGSIIPPLGNRVFKSRKYPIGFKGFDGHDLNPKGYIQLDPDTSFCRNIEGPVDTNTIGFEDLSFYTFKLYPNPTTGFFSVELPTENSLKRIIIYDLHGRIVKEDKIESQHECDIYFKGRPGLYFVVIKNGNVILSRQKLIVE